MTPTECIELTAQVASEYFCMRVTPAHITGKSRQREFVTPRQIAITVIREALGMKCTAVGKLFNCDHTTVLSGVKKVNDMLSVKDDLYITLHGRVLEIVEKEGYEKTAVITFPAFSDAQTILDNVIQMYNVRGYIVGGKVSENY